MDDVAAARWANGIELAYQRFGDWGALPVVLVMSLAPQMIAWPNELCESLARRSSPGESRALAELGEQHRPTAMDRSRSASD